MMKELEEYIRDIFGDTNSNGDIDTWIEFAVGLVSESEARDIRAALE